MNILRVKRKSKKVNYKKYLLLLFSLIMTTFAWFAYSKILDTDMNLHLISWDIKFIVNGQEKTNPLDIAVQELYPGMDDAIVDVVIQNNGKATALINYSISEISILGNTYTMTTNPDAVLGEKELYVPNPTVGETESVQYVINDARFPFTLDITSSNEVASETEGHLKIKISWAGTNDELDTQWGYDIAKYYDSSVSVPQPLRMTFKINAIQKDE